QADPGAGGDERVARLPPDGEARRRSGGPVGVHGGKHGDEIAEWACHQRWQGTSPTAFGAAPPKSVRSLVPSPSSWVLRPVSLVLCPLVLRRTRDKGRGTRDPRPGTRDQGRGTRD